MALLKHMLLVGDADSRKPFLKLFKKAGIEITEGENVKLAFKQALDIKPDGILFVTPRYGDEVTRFVDEIRTHPGFENLPIIYIGALIEGEDMRILQLKGVHTLTLGPVPHEEMVRYVVDKLG
jgi:response regulator RpfG family c-di-GMP phosphodiesterase